MDEVPQPTWEGRGPEEEEARGWGSRIWVDGCGAIYWYSQAPEAGRCRLVEVGGTEKGDRGRQRRRWGCRGVAPDAARGVQKGTGG